MSTDVVLRKARGRASRIREGIHGYLATLTAIAEAYRERDWIPLGYADWSAYVDGEFGADRLRIPAEHRRKAIEELRLAGMSQRAIASSLRVSTNTVAQVSPGETPEVVGHDGKTYPVARPTPPVPEFIPPPDLEDVAEEKPGTPVVEAMKAAIKETVERTQKAEPGVVQAYLEADPDVQAAEFMARFAGAIVKAGNLYAYSAERVAQLADDDVMDSLERHALLLADYVTEVKKHRPARLRLVKGA